MRVLLLNKVPLLRQRHCHVPGVALTTGWADCPGVGARSATILAITTDCARASRLRRGVGDKAFHVHESVAGATARAISVYELPGIIKADPTFPPHRA